MKAVTIITEAFTPGAVRIGCLIDQIIQFERCTGEIWFHKFNIRTIAEHCRLNHQRTSGNMCHPVGSIAGYIVIDNISNVSTHNDVIEKSFSDKHPFIFIHKIIGQIIGKRQTMRP